MKNNLTEKFKDWVSPSRKYNGLVPDLRSQSEKEQDWKATEVYSPEPPHFREVQEGAWAKYQVRNQANSGSCVANTVAKMLEVKYWLKTGKSIKFSHAPIYMHRSNKPTPGMIGVNALDLAKKYSSCPEEEFPSEYLSDAQLDSLSLPRNYEDMNNYVSPTNYLICPVDFDYVASMVRKEGAVMLWVDTSYSNWNQAIPVPGGRGGGVRHSITIVDTVKWNGVEYLVIEDSWGKFGRYDGQRLITREFFKANAFFAAVLTEFKYDFSDPVGEEFTTLMKYGEKSDEIKRLQDFLKTQGLFPSNQESTGYYGNITAKAVYLFQVQNKVAPLSELDQIKGIKSRVGSKTLSKINELLNKK